MTESAQGVKALREALDKLDQAGGFGIVDPRSARDAHELRWTGLARHVGALSGRRVLDVGGGGRDDALEFAARGAQSVLACVPADTAPAEPLDAEPPSGVEFRAGGWDTLDPARDGVFDLVHCHGLVHRVLDPMALLRTLRRLISDDGELLIGSMMLADPECSEFLRFIPDRHAGDPTWWFVPGRLAFRWLVQTAGFEVETEFGETEGPREGFPVVAGYLRARAATP